MPKGFTLGLLICFGLVAFQVLSSREHRKEIRDFVLNMMPGQSVVS